MSHRHSFGPAGGALDTWKGASDWASEREMESKRDTSKKWVLKAVLKEDTLPYQRGFVCSSFREGSGCCSQPFALGVHGGGIQKKEEDRSRVRKRAKTDSCLWPFLFDIRVRTIEFVIWEFVCVREKESILCCVCMFAVSGQSAITRQFFLSVWANHYRTPTYSNCTDKHQPNPPKNTHTHMRSTRQPRNSIKFLKKFSPVHWSIGFLI